MTTQFHLSFPVTSLDRSIDFYRRCLGAHPGRRQDDWCDVLLFEHQLTLHERPADVAPPGRLPDRVQGGAWRCSVRDRLTVRRCCTYSAIRGPSTSARCSGFAAIRDSVSPWNARMTILDDQLGRTGAYVAADRFTLADVVLG